MTKLEATTLGADYLALALAIVVTAALTLSGTRSTYSRSCLMKSSTKLDASFSLRLRYRRSAWAASDWSAVMTPSACLSLA
jgi:hypothetical protein